MNRFLKLSVFGLFAAFQVAMPMDDAPMQRVNEHINTLIESSQNKQLKEESVIYTLIKSFNAKILRKSRGFAVCAYGFELEEPKIKPREPKGKKVVCTLSDVIIIGGFAASVFMLGSLLRYSLSK